MIAKCAMTREGISAEATRRHGGSGDGFLRAGFRPMTPVKTAHSERFLKIVEDKRIVVVTHDNPDPDAIASGWALVTLLQDVRGQAARLMGRGAIIRAENLHMVRLLKPPLELVDDLPDDGTSIVLVDCSPSASNQPASDGADRVLAVIDHHEPTSERVRVAYRDIRPRAAATASIVAGYFREQHLEPNEELATAMLYAIRTELKGSETRLTRSTRSIVAWLSGRADHGKLAEIEAAPLSRAYFDDLTLALKNTDIYGNVAVCFLPQASGPEIVGEIADLLVRCEGVRKVLCGAAIGKDLVLSARTRRDSGDVLPLLRATLLGFGSWGGHRHRAGGKIPYVSGDGQAPELLLNTIKARWLTACEADQQPETPLTHREKILAEANR